MKNTKNKRITCIVVVILFICLTALGIYVKQVSDYKKSVKSIIIQDIVVSKIADGIYTGECNVGFIYVKAEVTVASGKIIKIDLIEHKNERGKTAEAVTGKIIEQQKLDVDAVSGATNSSIVIKKAVENALAGQEQ